MTLVRELARIIAGPRLRIAGHAIDTIDHKALPARGNIVDGDAGVRHAAAMRLALFQAGGGLMTERVAVRDHAGHAICDATVHGRRKTEKHCNYCNLYFTALFRSGYKRKFIIHSPRAIKHKLQYALIRAETLTHEGN